LRLVKPLDGASTGVVLHWHRHPSSYPWASRMDNFLPLLPVCQPHCRCRLLNVVGDHQPRVCVPANEASAELRQRFIANIRDAELSAGQLTYGWDSSPCRLLCSLSLFRCLSRSFSTSLRLSSRLGSGSSCSGGGGGGISCSSGGGGGGGERSGP
jgi:uncharacterized membrane protein YgcG